MFGGDALDHFVGRGNTAAAPAQHDAGDVGHVDQVLVQVPVPDAAACRFDGQAVALFVLLELERIALALARLEQQQQAEQAADEQGTADEDRALDQALRQRIKRLGGDGGDDDGAVFTFGRRGDLVEAAFGPVALHQVVRVGARAQVGDRDAQRLVDGLADHVAVGGFDNGAVGRDQGGQLGRTGIVEEVVQASDRRDVAVVYDDIGLGAQHQARGLGGEAEIIVCRGRGGEDQIGIVIAGGPRDRAGLDQADGRQGAAAQLQGIGGGGR